MSSTSRKAIFGCDFSAAATAPNATWLAQGWLEYGLAAPILTIESLVNTGSHNRSDLLAESLTSEAHALAGLDFPFSFPAPFAALLCAPRLNSVIVSGRDSEINSWQELATRVTSISYDDLLAQVRAAKPVLGGEIKRLTDNSTNPKAQSPLHQINPGMLKMTWHGMALLLNLQKRGYKILPFDGSATSLDSDWNSSPPNSALKRSSPAISVLSSCAIEVYPAAVLKNLGLPWRKYKGTSPEARQLRQAIIEALTLRSVNTIKASAPALVLPPDLADMALKSDDALDAVIAAVGAAIAFLDPAQTSPPANIAPLTAVEGWIYVTHHSPT